MRLKSIHIKGFKSFPLDTHLHFNERVTGVVGPNGSGKSNIVDAIRWVLGEQKTTELRLGSMSDVLFNGTNKRKKSGLAQVTLEFDNTKNLIPSEYNHVSISRYLFRNGDSEYRINDVPCRLKDVRSLFSDTGVGPDSYAIIALNMVDDILTDSNGSRRRMFEQASGISKYKKAKKETINKLNATTADLDRVEDLLFEIGNNLTELEKQARKVKRFLNIKEEYKAVSVQLQLTRFDKIQASRTALKKQIEEETDKHRLHSGSLRKKESMLQEQKKLIISNEQELSSYQKELNEMLDLIRKSESNKQLFVQQKEFGNQKKKNLIQDQSKLEQQIASLELTLKAINEKLTKEVVVQDDLNRTYQNKEKDYTEIKAKYQSVKADHDVLVNKKRALEEKIFQLEKSIAVDENKIESLQSLIDRKTDKKTILADDLKLTDQNRKEKKKSCALLEKNLEIQEQGIEDRKKKIDKLNVQKDELRFKKEKISRKLDARVNEYDLVKSMIDSFEGFPESIKYLNKKWNAKALLLTDIVYAPDAYKLSIESFLEPYLNYYVVDQAEEAFDALSLLHGSQKGKANFFILDKLDEKIPVTREIDGLYPALQWLEFDESYLKLFSRLLHNVYITDLEIPDLELLSEEFGSEEFYILDKKGSFISSNYKISGGSVGLFEGKKLGRKKNLEKLQEEIQKYKNEIVKEDNRLVKLRNEISTLEVSIDNNQTYQLKKEIEKEKIKLVELELNASSSLKQLEVLTTEVQQHDLDLKEVRLRIADSEININEIKESQKSLTADNNQDASLQFYSDSLSKASENRNTQHIEMIKHQSILDNLKNDQKYKTSDLERSNNQFVQNIGTLDELIKEQEKLEEKTITLDKTLVELYESKKQKENNLSDVERVFYEKRSSISDLEEEISGIRRNMHQSQFLINELKEKLTDQEFGLQSVKERLKIEFNLELSDLVGIERENIPLIELEEKHDRLKRKIEIFGEVNTMAVEAYDEMNIRFETISQQKEDIIQAKKSLLKTIEEIEEIATKKYLETFEVVNGHFKKVFTRLFNEGDTCNIEMEDPDNPLESRIEITAKPKGKRPKTLNQLSGGEKTLTAIALLFSLYLFKPAPFCIFDEVDAPLDDANIEKFNRIVKEFSTDSQFIIITHNKATMTAVDVLYGVFMQEMGVSEVAAVDFRNYEELNTIVASN